jgi:serine/threonine protein phosphatase PrpC
MHSSGLNTIMAEVFGCTDVGRAREHNEDAFAIVDLDAAPRTVFFNELVNWPVGKHGLLFMVADGMGGAAAGEVASAMAVDSVTRVLVERWADHVAPDPESFADALREATNHANSRIHQFAAASRDHLGMGTTATIAGMLGDKLFLSQVGDSRAYLARNGTVHQLTRDQSLMQRE